MHVAGLNTEQAENAMCFYIMQTKSHLVPFLREVFITATHSSIIEIGAARDDFDRYRCQGDLALR